MPPLNNHISPQRYRMVRFLSFAAQVFAFLLAIAVIITAMMEIWQYAEYYEVTKQPSRGVRESATCMIVCAAASLLCPLCFVVVYVVYPWLTMEMEYGPAKQPSGGKKIASSANDNGCVSHAFVAKAEEVNYYSCSISPRTPVQTVWQRLIRSRLPSMLSAARGSGGDDDYEVNDKPKKPNGVAMAVMANPLTRGGNSRDGPGQGNNQSASTSSTPVSNREEDSSSSSVNSITGCENLLSPFVGEASSEVPPPVMTSLPPTVAHKPGLFDRCDAWPPGMWYPTTVVLTYATVNMHVLRILQCTYYLVAVSSAILVFFFGLNGALSQALSVLTATLTVQEGWDYVFQEGRVDFELNDQLCLLQVKGSCSGGRLLCNATKYDSFRDAIKLNCPYCPLVQHEIATFTQTCADRYNLNEHYPIAYFCLLATVLTCLIFNVVISAYNCAHNVIPVMSYEEYMALMKAITRDAAEEMWLALERHRNPVESRGSGVPTHGTGSSQESTCATPRDRGASYRSNNTHSSGSYLHQIQAARTGGTEISKLGSTCISSSSDSAAGVQLQPQCEQVSNNTACRVLSPPATTLRGFGRDSGAPSPDVSALAVTVAYSQERVILQPPAARLNMWGSTTSVGFLTSSTCKDSTWLELSLVPAATEASPLAASPQPLLSRHDTATGSHGSSASMTQLTACPSARSSVNDGH